uniref:beta-galactosidase n=1 Tax=Oryza brachyantha TaxID=4533 RepID=J3LWC0_ORYBR
MARGGRVNVVLFLLGCSCSAAAAGEGVVRQVVAERSDDGGNFFESFNVTYDHRAVLIGGKRRMLISAGLHYPSATPEIFSWSSCAARILGVETSGFRSIRAMHFIAMVSSQILTISQQYGLNIGMDENHSTGLVYLEEVSSLNIFIVKHIKNMVLLQYLVGTLEADFVPRHDAYKESLDSVIFRESLLQMLLICCEGSPIKYLNGIEVKAKRGTQLLGKQNNEEAKIPSYKNHYFGRTNFPRTAGGPLQITSYDYDAPIDEYGILKQPKWGHLKDLLAAIKHCEPALIAVDGSPQYIKLGSMQETNI